MTKDQEILFTDIHELALDDNHMLVSYSKDKLAMANAVILQSNKKLLQIAELIQVALSD